MTTRRPGPPRHAGPSRPILARLGWLTLAALLSGCQADYTGLYEVVEHLLDVGTCEASTIFGSPLHSFEIVHEKDGLYQELQFHPCVAEGDCADEEDFDWGVSRGAAPGWDGYHIGSPGNMNPTCEVSATFVTLTASAGELRYTFEQREGTFDRPSDVDCNDAVQRDRDLVDCVLGEVRVGRLVQD